jgi:glycosyltransferase involved in cell wall biosynthesis
MKISFLLDGFGATGGPINLYRFMDKLSERGHEVYAIHPSGAIRWDPKYSTNRAIAAFWAAAPKGATLPKKVTPPKNKATTDFHRPSLKRRAFYYVYNHGGRKLGSIALSRTPRLRNKVASLLNLVPIYLDLNRDQIKAVQEVQAMTTGLLSNWVPSEVTIATYCFTAYAAYALMDKTVPLYYIQNYEELFFSDEIRQKLARLTYFMPLQLISGGSWVREQIRKRCGRNPYLLNPGIDHSIFFPLRDIREKYNNYRPLKIVSYARAWNRTAWPESVEAMRIVFSELGKDAVEWNAYYFPPCPSPPDDIKVNFVDNRYAGLAKLFSDSHINLQLCWYCGFPSAMLEPMACGTAVIASGLGVEELAVDGQNSLVVPPRDSKRLAGAIIRLARDPQLAQSLVEKGIETAKQYTWERAADNAEQIIRKAVRDYPFSSAFSDIPDLTSGKLL